MKNEPYVICGVITGVLSLLREHWKIDHKPLLQAAGLSEDIFDDYDNHASLHSFAILLEEAAKLTGDKALVLKLTARFDTVTAGLINKYATMSAPTLRHSLQANARYSSLTFDIRKGEIIEEGGNAIARWSYWKGFGGMQQFPNWLPGRLVTLMRQSLGQDWSPVRVKLEHAAPDHLQPFQEFFGPDLKFNQTENSIELLSSDLDNPMPKSDNRLWGYIINFAEEVLTKQTEKHDVVNLVQKHIIEALPQDRANIKYVAEQLGKSPRTLQRDLTAANTSFSKLLENIRKDLADKYLLDSDLHISQITFLLGFAEVSVCSRAVNRWFGMSPSAYRQKKRSQKSENSAI